jgi:hypothetical protein
MIGFTEFGTSVDFRTNSSEYFDDTQKYFDLDVEAKSRRPVEKQSSGVITKQIGIFQFSPSEDVRVSVRRSPLYGDIVSMMFIKH